MQKQLQYVSAILILLATLLTPSALRAAGDEDTKAEVTVFGGGFHFGSGGTHPALGGYFGFNAFTRVQLFAEAGYVPLGSYGTSLAGVSASGSDRLFNVGGGALANIGPRSSKAAPYILAAVGDGHQSISGSGTVAGYGFSSSASSNSIYAGAGAGVRVHIGDSWGIRPEFRYQRYVQNGGANGVMFTVGLFYGFLK
jgi:hypothetical protein